MQNSKTSSTENQQSTPTGTSLTLQSAEETLNKNSSTSYEPIENSPFIIVQDNSTEQTNWFIATGKAKLSKLYPTKEQAMSALKPDNEFWNIIFHLIVYTHQVIAEDVAKSLTREIQK